MLLLFMFIYIYKISSYGKILEFNYFKLIEMDINSFICLYLL